MTQSRTEEVSIASLDEAKAQVLLTNVVLNSTLNDATTGEVKHRYGTGKGDVAVIPGPFQRQVAR